MQRRTLVQEPFKEKLAKADALQRTLLCWLQRYEPANLMVFPCTDNAKWLLLLDAWQSSLLAPCRLLMLSSYRLLNNSSATSDNIWLRDPLKKASSLCTENWEVSFQTEVPLLQHLLNTALRAFMVLFIFQGALQTLIILHTWTQSPQ